MKQCVQQAHFTIVQPVLILAVISCDKTLEIVLFIRSYKVYLIKKLATRVPNTTAVNSPVKFNGAVNTNTQEQKNGTQTCLVICNHA